MLSIAEQKADLAVSRNQPYGPEDGVTHTLRRQALPLGLLNVMLEIRNDLISDPPAQTRMAERLAGYLSEALASFNLKEKAANHA